MPTVSVLMAVYNGEAWLREAIDSILGQTFTDLEFVIVDDGSTDGSADIIASYRDPRIRSIRNARNSGLTRSLNLGLAECRGALVARQDADDVSEPSRLAEQVAYLEAHPDVAVVGTWYTKIGPDGEVLGTRPLPTLPLEIQWAMLFHCPLIHSGVLFRREVLARETGFYDERFSYAQDYDLWSRVADRLPVANVPAYLLRLRINPASMTATYGERTLEGPQISLALMTRLLGRALGPAPERKLAALQTLVLRTGLEVPASELVAATADLLALHEAFCARRGLPPAEAAAGGARLREGVARRLTELAANRRSRSLSERRELLRGAWALSPTALLSADGLRAFAGLGLPERVRPG
jgi:hypothetical protein